MQKIYFTEDAYPIRELNGQVAKLTVQVSAHEGWELIGQLIGHARPDHQNSWLEFQYIEQVSPTKKVFTNYSLNQEQYRSIVASPDEFQCAFVVQKPFILLKGDENSVD